MSINLLQFINDIRNTAAAAAAAAYHEILCVAVYIIDRVMCQ
jgi:hypothetical protein